MMRSSIRAGMLILTVVFAISPIAVDAQLPDAPSAANQSVRIYSPQRLDQLLAPIALYPDALLSQILMASTYPLEVVQAARWVKVPSNAALRGDQLAAALDQVDWDPSVKALISFPRILQTMDDKLSWMQQLGDAFLAQQDDVMDSVQRLRREARAAGNLATTPQQVVTDQGPNIVVQSASPTVIYVPYYDPTFVYGIWPYPLYPPLLFPPPPGYVHGPRLYFGIGFTIATPFWGWVFWDWGHRYFRIDVVRYNHINRHEIDKHHYAPVVHERWEHDPYHRRGVAYRDADSRTRFTRAPSGSPDQRRVFRGYEDIPAPNREGQGARPRAPSDPRASIPSGPTRPGAERQAPATQGAPGGPTPETQGQQPAAKAPGARGPSSAVQAPTTQRASPAQTPSRDQRSATQRAPSAIQGAPTVQRPTAPTVRRPTPPAFEGISRGPDVRAQSSRGHESQRAVSPSNAPRPAAPAPHEPAGGGSSRGDSRGGGSSGAGAPSGGHRAR